MNIFPACEVITFGDINAGDLFWAQLDKSSLLCIKTASSDKIRDGAICFESPSNGAACYYDKSVFSSSAMLKLPDWSIKAEMPSAQILDLYNCEPGSLLYSEVGAGIFFHFNRTRLLLSLRDYTVIEPCLGSVTRINNWGIFLADKDCHFDAQEILSIRRPA